MTALGKILVFLNLIFSLFIAGLMITTFITRTNWKNGYDAAKNARDVAQAQLKSEWELWQKERDALTKTLTELDNKINVTVASLAKEQERSKVAEEKLNKALAATSGEVDNNKLATAELERIKAERVSLQSQLTNLQVKLQDATKSSVTDRDKAVAADIAFKSVRERNDRLLEQIEQLNKTIQSQRFQNAGSSTEIVAGQPVKPIAEDVRGTITSTDTSTGLATISIGSDAGLSRNNVLQVYRLAPAPTYLGTMQILSTRPHEAVGRFTPTSKRLPMQVGDEVASKVVGGPKKQ